MMWESSSISEWVALYIERNPLKTLVPKAGLEPARPLRRGILNPLRLPFRHLGRVMGLPQGAGQGPE